MIPNYQKTYRYKFYQKTDLSNCFKKMIKEILSFQIKFILMQDINQEIYVYSSSLFVFICIESEYFY
jgi:hypothetical protein